jgi:dUTP pyrophosphatase
MAFASEEISLLYSKAVEKHNQAFIRNGYCDSGVDLFVPNNVVFDKELEAKFVDMKLKTEMVYCDVSDDAIYPTAYYLYPRSSLSKTPLILANHVGIIDAGYRGSVISAFKWAPSPNSGRAHYAVEEGTRLTQICHPTLCPIYIRVVEEDDLTDTERGSGGFGSTGR